MFIPSLPFCTVILLFLSRTVLALPQPGESILLHNPSSNWFKCFTQKGAAFSAPVKDIGTHKKASDALGLASEEHFQLALDHEKKSFGLFIPGAAQKHHAEAAKFHLKTGLELAQARIQADGVHNAEEMHETAQHALKSAQSSRKAMDKMDDIARTKRQQREGGHAATTKHTIRGLNRDYISTSKQALDELKASKKM